MKIVLDNVASFRGEPTVLEIDKKINLMYGLNGTGKTTLSDFFYFRENKSKFENCQLEGVREEKILVYNKNFVKDHFYDKEELSGIFTLSKENKQAEIAINHANAEKQSKEREKLEKEQEKNTVIKKKNQKLESVLTDIWDIKTNYTGGDRALGFCLDGLNRKQLLFDYIKRLEKLPTRPNKTIIDLEEELNALTGENAQKYDLLRTIELDAGHLEKNSILSEVIIGNEDSPVSELITSLDNASWVKDGLAYLPTKIDKNTEPCPFCQQETITKQIAQDIRSYFDGIYDEKVEKIKNLKSDYSKVIPTEIIGYAEFPLMKGHKGEFEKLYSQLKSLVDGNLQKIEEKIGKPNTTIVLDVTIDKIGKLNNLLNEVNEKIKKHNEQIENKEETKQKIKETFWQIMRWDYDSTLTLYHSENNGLDIKLRKIAKDIERIEGEIKMKDDEISKQQMNMINIEEAIQNINSGLNELGIDGFKIVKHSDNSYRIVRENKSSDQFSTLSEGEKMIITFLYFVELCKGKENKEEVEKEKIIVIDDPISSLSHTYIFNLSQWIKNNFLGRNYKQVFILTHSLYFFHEIVRHCKDKALFRFIKSSENGSKILAMCEGEIKNEYESYWQVIKDHAKSQASNALLASTMRNILEHFFAFTKSKELKTSLQELGNNKEYEAFFRFISRESHSDAINITDTKEIDPQNFKTAFKEIFYSSGYKEHYDSMIGDGNSTSNVL